MAKYEIPLFGICNHYHAPHKNTVMGHCLAGSLTGEVDSYNATESHKGWLALEGNQSDSAMAKASLTARHTSRAGTKVGLNDPVMGSGTHTA